MFPYNDCETGPEEVAIMNRCRLLLIEAGAVPTLGEDEISESFIGDMLYNGTTVLLVTL